jgi:mono/diheme cytochrome c family protein
MAETRPQSSESLARWLVSGLLAGAAVLGIAIGAYAVGYHRGQHHPHKAAVASTAPSATTAATSTAAVPATTAQATVVPTAALVGQGKRLYAADACSGCHSLTGAAGAGPSFKSLAGSTVTLDNGQTVTADDAYLARSITDPDAEIVKGFHAGLMPAAIASYHLASKPSDVRALVAFIRSLR